jgi:DNA-binding SARP family transcriptional activator
VTRFGLLGTVVVRDGDVLSPVNPPMARTLLAALLVSANRIVPAERLVDVMWNDSPPASAIASLHNHVARLRSRLAGTGAVIRTVAPGYLLNVAPDDLDVEAFTGHVDRAARASATGEWAAAEASLTAALALWRGDPLADVTSQVLRTSEMPRLHQLLLDAQEARVDAYLHLRRYPEAIAQLHSLTAAHPLRERFHEQLMIACSRAGRVADALAAYQRARQVLRDELGIEPGPSLQELHHQVLTGDPAVSSVPPRVTVPLQASVVNTPGPARGPAGPVQLPADTADFTGRDAQVASLCDELAREPDDARPGAVTIAVVTGMGGVGKTTLAIHAAHRLRSRFPDGQLFANLDGGGITPRRPAEVLARFLRDLGVPDGAIPDGLEERAARYRSLLAGRRVLVMLDDARDATQVRPLLPGSATSAVIVTSRHTLVDLSRSRLLRLDVLDDRESLELFNSIVGEERVAAEQAATAGVLGSCAGLPLAVRIAASRLASRPRWSLAHLATRLADEQTLLSELTAGDLGIRASLAVSYEALREARPQSARVFRLLGLASTADISLPAVAALAGQPQAEAAQALEDLVDSHLLDCPAPERFRMHDLVRSYAAELAKDADAADERKAALDAMFRWYRDHAISEGLLGDAYLDRGAAQDAVAHYERALAAYTATAPSHIERAGVLRSLGHALLALGRASEARDAWRLAIPIFDRDHDPKAAELRERLESVATTSPDKTAPGPGRTILTP